MIKQVGGPGPGRRGTGDDEADQDGEVDDAGTAGDGAAVESGPQPLPQVLGWCRGDQFTGRRHGEAQAPAPENDSAPES
jgi:hypothetical protein